MGLCILRLLVLLGLSIFVQAHTSGACYDGALGQFYFLTYHRSSSWTNPEGMNCRLLDIIMPSGAELQLNWTEGVNTLVGLNQSLPNVYPDICNTISDMYGGSSSPVLTNEQTTYDDNVQSCGIIAFSLTETGWYNFSSPAVGPCGNGPAFAALPFTWREYVKVPEIPTPSLGLGELASASDAARAQFAATAFNTTSINITSSMTSAFVLTSEGNGTFPVPPTYPATAAAEITIISWGEGVKKAVVSIVGLDELSTIFTTGNGSSPNITDTSFAFAFLVDRMSDNGTMMNGLPFSFSIPTNGNSAVNVEQYAAQTKGSSAAENASSAKAGAVLVISAEHTSSFIGDYQTEGPWPEGPQGAWSRHRTEK